MEIKKYLSPSHSGADGYSSLLRHNAVLTGTKVSPFRKGLLSLTSCQLSGTTLRMEAARSFDMMVSHTSLHGV